MTNDNNNWLWMAILKIMTRNDDYNSEQWY